MLLTTAISRWKYQFSSDHWSQATLSLVSTWMGDRLGTPSAVVILLFALLISDWDAFEHCLHSYLMCIILMTYSFFILMASLFEWTYLLTQVKLSKCSSLHFTPHSRQRPYHVENTSSRPITEVKQRWAWLVLGWETAWEHQVLLSSFYLLYLFLTGMHLNIACTLIWCA